ncbi:hypothetical protein FC093_07320 [Ilyomonas limi]|uniref:Uncharacterized protein n=1 Tax=Ilyomonas limi TaxID=2575867 RepID=A0A4U3L437_9BACT|nr:contractile injection system tape measure protein [Ilyomonas limi]TKK69878.1 hypothetical protein FC093_07320 [Ilyomonas limi]
MTIDVTIRKQKIKVVTTSEQYALQIRKHLNDRLQYDLITVLETIFSGKLSSDEYITIDKLKIDLGTITPDVFEQHFVELIAPKLKTALQKLAEQNGSSLFNEETNAAIAGLHSNSKQAQEIKALLYFLEHGIYPWWYKKEEQETPTTLLANLSKEATDTLLLSILSIQKSSSDAGRKVIERLFIHLSETRNESIIHQLLSLYHSSALTNNVEALIDNKQDLIQLFSITVKEFYKNVFQLIIDENTEKDRNAINSFIDQLSKRYKIFTEESRREVDLSNSTNTLKDTLDLNKKKQASTSSKTEQEGIYISNAGLVLLHPFLPPFFKASGLLNTQDQFISVAARQKAAVLLYYLQCNDEQYKEWEMAFNKIICGIPVEDILPAGIAIAKNEQEECRALLQSMVDYWDALKGASIEAVQNTFILREGKITLKEDHWLLQVERTGVDILLERLPWSYSTTKLPWLNQLIYTEW